MEFAVEAQKLLGVSLEGSVGDVHAARNQKPARHASAGNEILQGHRPEVDAGEVHAIMGPNGSGKSTLAHVLAGRDDYEVTGGRCLYEGKDLLALSPEERAREGVFLAFQYPVEIPGVSNTYFLGGAQRRPQAPRPARARRHGLPRARQGEDEAGARSTRRCSTARSTRASPAARRSATRSSRWRCWSPRSPSSTRPIPASTSTPCASSPTASTRCAQPGPRRCWSSPTTSACSNYIVPDSSTSWLDGRIVRSGGKELALELEEKGYAWLEEAAAQPVGA